MHNSVKFFCACVFVSTLAACGGGGGGGGGNSTSGVDAQNSIYLAESYVNSALDDSSINGLFMLVESSTLQFDLDNFSAFEGLFELDYQRRALFVIFDTEDGRALVFHCLDNNGVSLSDIEFSGGTLSGRVEGYDFTASVVNNNRLEGAFSGGAVFSDSGAILRSQFTLVKIDDFTDEDGGLDLGTLSATFVDGDTDTTTRYDNFSIELFEQVDFEGEGVVEGQLVPIVGQSIYFPIVERDEIDPFIAIDFGEVTLIDIASDGERVRSVDIETQDDFLINESTANITISGNSINNLSGTASAVNDFASSERVSISFDIPL